MKLNNKYCHIFLDPETGGDGGIGTIEQPNAFQETFQEDNDDVSEGRSGGTTEKQEKTVAKPPTETPAQAEERIARAVAQGLQRTQQQNKPARQWTQAEVDKAFSVYHPTEDLVARIQAGGADAAKALTEFRDGVIQQARALWAYEMKEANSKMQSEYAPALTYAQEAKAALEREIFFETHADLDQHQVAVETVFSAMKAEGLTFPSVDEAYKALADRTRNLLGLTGNSGTTSPGSSVSGQQTQQNRPAQLSRGSGVGGGTGTAAARNPFQEIYG